MNTIQFTLRGEQFGPLHDQVDRCWLLVRWIAVARQQATDCRSYPGPDLLLLAPVNGRVVAYRVDQLAGDLL
jgi:hypothetical protein